MDITLNTGNSPLTQTGLTAGAFYSLTHKGPVTVSEPAASGQSVTLYEGRADGKIHIPVLGGTSLTFELGAGGSTTYLRLTQSA